MNTKMITLLKDGIEYELIKSGVHYQVEIKDATDGHRIFICDGLPYDQARRLLERLSTRAVIE